MIVTEYAHYLGVLIMSFNIKLSSNKVNISDKYDYGVIKYALNISK